MSSIEFVFCSLGSGHPSVFSFPVNGLSFQPAVQTRKLPIVFVSPAATSPPSGVVPPTSFLFSFPVVRVGLARAQTCASCSWCHQETLNNMVTTSHVWLFKFKWMNVKHSLKFTSSAVLAMFWVLSSHTWLSGTYMGQHRCRTRPSSLKVLSGSSGPKPSTPLAIMKGQVPIQEPQLGWWRPYAGAYRGVRDGGWRASLRMKPVQRNEKRETCAPLECLIRPCLELIFLNPSVAWVNPTSPVFVSWLRGFEVSIWHL